jgi:hypothetical protein
MNDEPVFLTVDDVLALHVDQIREFGGSEGRPHWAVASPMKRANHAVEPLMGAPRGNRK